jgi:RNA polymerase sigma factor (sigma-70 family)
MSFVDQSTVPDPDDRAQWPDRIRTLALAWQHSPDVDQRSRIMVDLWPLVHATLARYVRLHGESIGRVNAEEARDIASEKSVAFLRNLENNTRDLDALHTFQIRSYLSVLARNGLVDALRRSSRRSAHEVPEIKRAGVQLAPDSDGAEVNVRYREFQRALCQCVEETTPRARLVWFLRMFLDMPSKTIAVHPGVGMTPPSVDMMLSRMRKTVRECMMTKGFNSDDAPPGTFMALWELLGGEKLGAKYEEGDPPAPD